MKAKSSNYYTERFLYSGVCFGLCGFLVDPAFLMIRATYSNLDKFQYTYVNESINRFLPP
jgi:hypothetical protein